MKTTNFWSLSLLAATLMVGGLSFNSCKKDEVEPVPEVVENPLEKEAYFITGKVTDGTNALADVSVSAGKVSAKTDASGAYQIEVDKKGSFELSFAKDGYITIKNEVTVDSKAEKGATVFYSQILTKQAEAVKVTPEKDALLVITQNTEAFVPAGAVEKETDIAITSFVPAADKKLKEVADKAVSTSTPQTTSSALALSSFDCQPDGVKFEKPLEIRVKALEADNDVYFTEVKHYVNGTDNAEVIYDDSDKSYVLQLDGFSVHELRVVTDLSAEPNSETLLSEEVDNLGKTTAVSKDFSVKAKAGWKVVSKSKGVTGDVEAMLMAALRNVLASEGVSEIAMSKSMAVSGDMKMTVTYKQAVIRYTIRVKTNRGVESIVVEQYGAVSQNIEKEQGNMKPEHN